MKTKKIIVPIKIKVKIHKENNGYWAESPDCPGAFTMADNLKELDKNMKESVGLWIEGVIEYARKQYKS